jgi:hypothetical protein
LSEIFHEIVTEFSRDGQDRDKGGADYVAETRAAAWRCLLRPIGAPEPRHMNEAGRAGVGTCERKIKRFVADIIAGIGRQAASEALATKCGFDLAIGNGRARGMWRAGDYRESARARSRGVAVNETQPVQRPRFDAEKFPPRGEAEMQNRIGLERFVELFEFSRDLSIIDRQHIGFELDAEACQSLSMSAKRMDQ